jgi:phenylacetate-CoA ligase
LAAPERALLEQAFGCPVFETYGSREFMLMAAECPAHQGLHLSMENLHLELLDDQGAPTPPGQVGRVVVTDLHNLAQPFIRYQNDDLAVMAQGPCPCGRTLPRLARVEGRILDQIATPDGRRVSGTIFPHLLKDFPAVRDYQARQESLESLVLSIVQASPLSEADRLRLLAILGKALPGMRVEIRLVESIPPTPSGKRRVSIGLASGPST